MSSQAKDISRIKNIPISFFSVVMGLSGLTIALQKAGEVAYVPAQIGVLVAGFTTAAMVVLLVAYGAKIIRYPQAVRTEYRHPVKMNFFPTVAISLLLLAVVYMPYSEVVSRWLWWSGMTLQFVAMLTIINSWMWSSAIKVMHMNPAWFIPAVGSLIVPVAGVVHAPIEVSWFFFAIGTLFWIILVGVFFNRIFFHDMLSKKLLPTLFILIAPPAVIPVALYRLLGDVPLIGVLSYDVALFMFLLLIARPAQFANIQFYLSWWAYSFPLAAMAIASHTLASVYGENVYEYVFVGFLSLLIGLISMLLAKTAKAIYHKKICVEE